MKNQDQQSNDSSKASNRALSNLQPEGFPPIPTSWIAEDTIVKSYCGRLNLFRWFLHEEPIRTKRVLLIVHGLGEHSGRYDHVPSFMQGTLGGVCGFDLRGHGRSEGLRGDVEDFDDYVRDAAHVANELSRELKERDPEIELHLLGHSMGGLIALRLLFLHPEIPFASATLSAPLLGLPKVPAGKLVGAHALKLLWSSLQLTNTVNPLDLSHDRCVVEAYQKDRLVHEKVTPRYFFALKRAMADTHKRKSGILVPLQFLIPLQDRVVDPNGSLKFVEKFDHARTNRMRVIRYDDFYHEILNEIQKERVFEDLKSWIQTHPVSAAGQSKPKD